MLLRMWALQDNSDNDDENDSLPSGYERPSKFRRTEADEALQQVVDEGIKDQMTASQPPKELKEPDA